MAPQDVTTGGSWLDRQAVSRRGGEKKRGGSKGKLRGGGGRMEKRRETVEIISNVKVTKARTYLFFHNQLFQ